MRTRGAGRRGRRRPDEEDAGAEHRRDADRGCARNRRAVVAAVCHARIAIRTPERDTRVRHWNRHDATTYHRELAEYEPGDGRPVHSVARRRALRIMVVLGLVGADPAGRARHREHPARDRGCRLPHRGRAGPRRTRSARSPASSSRAPTVPGWYCYAERFGGSRDPAALARPDPRPELRSRRRPRQPA